ncbi:Insulin-like receptor [Gryllus bimaculatus]|nr:Insulin-like receptor [Gryllus bimaculatus]
MQEGITVGDWREQYKEVCKKKGVTPSNYAGYAYDAVWTYAYALDKLARENQTYLIEIHSDTTTRRFVEVLQNTNFDGVSGNIQFINGGPSRVTTIHVLQWLKKTTHIVGTFPPPIDDKWCCLNASKIVWLTPKGVKPEDGTEEPIGCVLASLAKLMNGNCEAAIIVANVIGFGLLGIFLIIGFLVVKRRYEHKVRQTENYMKSLGIDLLVASDLDKWEIPRDHVVINRKLGEGAFGTVYGGEAHFPEKGWVAVAVKTLKVGSTTEEKLDFLSEAEVMKRFEHKNVVKLLGVCTKNEPVYTVMEFMLYGDLKTYLLARRHLVNERLSEESDDISSKKLTSMALDVARALRMLPVRWMAPESLALGIFTPASDIWSFGVLLYEVITFGSFPFQGMSNNEVLDYVKEGYTLKVPKGIKPQLEGLIYSCWNKDYKARPHASEIVEFIANNPRLITPNLDVPASAVQPEEGGGGLGLPVRRRRSSAPSDGSAAGYPNRNMGSPCTLPPLLGDGEFSATLQDVGNEELLVGCVHEPLLRPPNANTGPALGLGLTKYASLQHDSDEYCTQDTPNAVSMLYISI